MQALGALVGPINSTFIICISIEVFTKVRSTRRLLCLALSVVMDTLSKNYLANSLQAAVEMHGQKQHISGQKEKVTLQKKDHSADLFKKAVYFVYLYLFICIFDRNRAQLFSLANLHPQSLGRRHS